MNLYVSCLVLEVTRRCNMLCEHCMRGDAQNLDMSNEVINKVFEQVHAVSDLTLSGGEPSLAVSVIEKVTEHIIMRGTEVSNFFVVTNGKTTTARAKKFAHALLNLYFVMSSPEEELTGLVVSGDAWHEKVKIPHVYEGLSFFMGDRRHGPTSEEGVINEGRAYDNGIGRRRSVEVGSFEVDDTPNIEQVLGTLFVAANGNVSSICDISYARMDEEPIGNVLKTPLIDIIRQWEEKIGYQLAANA